MAPASTTQNKQTSETNGWANEPNRIDQLININNQLLCEIITLHTHKQKHAREQAQAQAKKNTLEIQCEKTTRNTINSLPNNLKRTLSTTNGDVNQLKININFFLLFFSSLSARIDVAVNVCILCAICTCDRWFFVSLVVFLSLIFRLAFTESIN